MKKKKAKKVAPPQSNVQSSAKIEGLLAQLLLQSLGESANRRKKAHALSLAGLTNLEIAELMGVSADNVGVILHRARKSGTGTKKKTKKATKKR